MIEVNGRLYPFSCPTNREACNHLIYSPWTGRTWAHIDFQCNEWIGMRLPAAGEQPYFEGHIPGSLFLDYSKWILEHLPHELLLREINLLVDLQSPVLSWYDCPTIHDQEYPMSQPLTDRIALLRTKVLSNTASDEELREALKQMRAGRVSASRSSAAKKAAAAPLDPDAAVAAIFG